MVFRQRRPAGVDRGADGGRRLGAGRPEPRARAIPEREPDQPTVVSRPQSALPPPAERTPVDDLDADPDLAARRARRRRASRGSPPARRRSASPGSWSLGLALSSARSSRSSSRRSAVGGCVARAPTRRRAHRGRLAGVRRHGGGLRLPDPPERRRAPSRRRPSAGSRRSCSPRSSIVRCSRPTGRPTATTSGCGTPSTNCRSGSARRAPAASGSAPRSRWARSAGTLSRGEEPAVKCRICGADLPEGAMFCGDCGSSTSATPESRRRVRSAARRHDRDRAAGAAQQRRDQHPGRRVPRGDRRSRASRWRMPRRPAAPDAPPTRGAVRRADGADAVDVADASCSHSAPARRERCSAPDSSDASRCRSPARRSTTSCRSRIASLSVSKTHLEFGEHDGVLWVADRFSGNGTDRAAARRRRAALRARPALPRAPRQPRRARRAVLHRGLTAGSRSSTGGRMPRRRRSVRRPPASASDPRSR